MSTVQRGAKRITVNPKEGRKIVTILAPPLYSVSSYFLTKEYKIFSPTLCEILLSNLLLKYISIFLGVQLL